MVLAKANSVVVVGMNIYKKHIKASVAVDKKGGVYDIPRPIDVAKIALICPNCKKVTRIGFKEGQRVCRKCGKKLEKGGTK